MSDSIDKPGTTNLGARTPAVQKAPELSSGTELTMETLDTISAAGVGTIDEVKWRDETSYVEQGYEILGKHPGLTLEQYKKLINESRPVNGFQGDSNA